MKTRYRICTVVPIVRNEINVIALLLLQISSTAYVTYVKCLLT